MADFAPDSRVRRAAGTRRLAWRGLFPQLFLFIILPLSLISLVVSFGSLSLHQQAMRNLVGERDERTARSVARAISDQLNHRAALIQGLALGASTQVPSDFLASASYFLADFDIGIALYDMNGGLLTTSRGDWAVRVPESLATPLTEGADPLFSSPVLGSNGDVLMSVAVSDGRTLAAVGVFSVSAIIRSTLANSFIPGDQAAAFVVDANMQPLYQTDSRPLAEHGGIHPGIALALDGESGVTYFPAASGDEHVVAYTPITPVGWAFALEERWEDVDNPVLRTTQFAPLAIIPLFLVVLVVLWFGLRQIVQPLQALATRAAELGWGHFQAIETSVGGIVEIQRLQTELVYMARKVKASQESLHDYISAITSGQEEERARLARELHDETIQSLIVLNQRAQLAQLASVDSSDRAPLSEIQGLIEQAIANLRRLIRALRPLYLEELGLAPALEMLAREMNQESGLSVEYQRTGADRRLPPDTELALYRMAQEALNNVMRHASASRASLTVQFRTDETVITISDNGRGFGVPQSPADYAAKGHFGLLGLYERADLIGADVNIRSSTDLGTQVTITLPAGLSSAILDRRKGNTSA